MKKVIREVDEKRGIVQVTIADERWYVKEEKDPKTELPALMTGVAILAETGTIEKCRMLVVARVRDWVSIKRVPPAADPASDLDDDEPITTRR